MAEATATASPGTWVDPFRAYNFRLEIDSITQGHFTECSGIDMEAQAIPYREAGAGQIVHQVAGPVTYRGMTLRWGVTTSRELWDWFMNVAKGKADRRSAAVILVASDGVTDVVRWDLAGAWPSRFRGVSLDALGHEVAVESVTLVFESVERR